MSFQGQRVVIGLAQVYIMVMSNGNLTGEVLHIDGGGRHI